jgi:hypothetical protein
MTRSASIKGIIQAIRKSLETITKNGGGDVVRAPLVAVNAAVNAYADLSTLEKLIDPKQVIVQDRLDIFTDNGEYLFTVAKGNDGLWRRVYMYRNVQGQEAIGSIAMERPDYRNDMGMNI